MRTVINKRAERQRRHARLRKRVFGTADRPRLAVYRSHQHIYCQIINDEAGHTLVAASTLEPEVKGDGNEYLGNADAARKIGERIAQKAREAGIESVVFDRGGNKYHGRVAALADAAREHGLQF
jgi:large subunit ribosomal protein L18